jgi:hypothetical protein
MFLSLKGIIQRQGNPQGKTMRLSVIAALLSVGLFAGCGGVELEAQEAEVTAMAPPPCERACMTLYNHCMRNATTPEQQAWCVEDQDLCYQGCYPGAAPVQAMRPPPCEYACDLGYTACMRSASTQAQKDACVAERNDCYGFCEPPALAE